MSLFLLKVIVAILSWESLNMGCTLNSEARQKCGLCKVCVHREVGTTSLETRENVWAHSFSWHKRNLPFMSKISACQGLGEHVSEVACLLHVPTPSASGGDSGTGSFGKELWWTWWTRLTSLYMLTGEAGWKAADMKAGWRCWELQSEKTHKTSIYSSFCEQFSFSLIYLAAR